MADYDEDEDFFEEDESVEEIVAVFNRGEKGITRPPGFDAIHIAVSRVDCTEFMRLGGKAWVSAAEDWAEKVVTADGTDVPVPYLRLLTSVAPASNTTW